MPNLFRHLITPRLSVGLQTRRLRNKPAMTGKKQIATQNQRFCLQWRMKKDCHANINICLQWRKNCPVIARFFVEKSWQSVFCHAEFISASRNPTLKRGVANEEIAEQVRNDSWKTDCHAKLNILPIMTGNQLPSLRDFSQKNRGNLFYVMPNLFRHLLIRTRRCRNKFGMTI